MVIRFVLLISKETLNIYQYFDHTGNVRVSFARNSAGGLQLKDNNDYYPFGMNHLKTGNSYFGAGSYVKYKFGSKELQEYGAYDFGARAYMADIARWFAVDPMAEENPGLTPYRYGFNNPVMFTDPNGMLEQGLIDGMLSQEGTWYNTGVGFTNTSTMKSMDYDGHAINWSQESTDSILEKIGIVGGTAINIPMVIINGKHNRWGNAAQDYFNSYMRNWNGESGAIGAIGKLTSYIASLIGTTNETFYSFSGGANDPDKETLNKLRPKDKIEANNMFEYIINGYGRAVKTANVSPDRFQLGIDIASLLPFVSNKDLLNRDVALVEKVSKSPLTPSYDTVKIVKQKNKYRDSVEFNKAVKSVSDKNDINFYNRVNFLGKSNWQ